MRCDAELLGEPRHTAGGALDDAVKGAARKALGLINLTGGRGARLPHRGAWDAGLVSERLLGLLGLVGLLFGGIESVRPAPRDGRLPRGCGKPCLQAVQRHRLRRWAAKPGLDFI